MASNLYQELGIPADAAHDQIRKAYKKRALQTHPDRLPPGATPQQKAEADEKFRRVNNAYEVLSDSKKRREYDVHGVWPPPEEEDDPFTSRMPGGSRSHGFSRAHPSRNRTSGFPDAFAFNHRNAFRGFTDPYDLFDSLFENTFHAHSRPRHASYPQMGQFEQIHRMQAEIESFMDDIDRDPFAQLGGFPRMPMLSSPIAMMQMPQIPMPSGRDRHGRQWVSDSYVTSTVNGVTQTIHKRVDSEGNEHITRTLPDGQKVRTINGIEQPSSAGYLPYNPEPSPKNRHSPVESSGYRYKVSPTSNFDYDYATPPMPSNLTPPPSYHEHAPPMDNSGYRRTRRSSDKYAYTSQPPNPDPRSHDDLDRHHHKKRWWQH
ncbi:hypothetical protein D9619_006352 [Psilocybe cf. subviscida]|uniref:J domain-containing protein n=1 Tax=Psilocybe cf. subviscida TaxID=2480587 RepID=A0A8H5EXI2_9AGAR|nr:hypothetical protein D9619_006352 [Psilocybe cf. subviscida]